MLKVHMSDSDRSRRPSTVKATERQEERGRLRQEVLVSKRKSAKLKETILTEETAFVDSVQEIARFAVLANVQTDPEIGTVNSEAVNIDNLGAASRPAELETDEESDLESETEWDPLGVSITPKKTSAESNDSPLSLLGHGFRQDPESWSTANQFFPPGCTITPQLVLRPVSGTSLGSRDSSNFSPRSNLPNI